MRILLSHEPSTEASSRAVTHAVARGVARIDLTKVVVAVALAEASPDVLDDAPDASNGE